MHRESLTHTLHAILADFMIRAGFKPNFKKNGKRITIETNICIERLKRIIETAIEDEKEIGK